MELRKKLWNFKELNNWTTVKASSSTSKWVIAIPQCPQPSFDTPHNSNGPRIPFHPRSEELSSGRPTPPTPPKKKKNLNYPSRICQNLACAILWSEKGEVKQLWASFSKEKTRSTGSNLDEGSLKSNLFLNNLGDQTPKGKTICQGIDCMQYVILEQQTLFNQCSMKGKKSGWNG